MGVDLIGQRLQFRLLLLQLRHVDVIDQVVHMIRHLLEPGPYDSQLLGRMFKACNSRGAASVVGYNSLNQSVERPLDQATVIG